MDIVERRRRKIRSVCPLGLAARMGCRGGGGTCRRLRSSRSRQRRAVLHVLQRALDGIGMRIDTVGHHGAVRCGEGSSCGPRARPRARGRRAIWCCVVPVRRGDAIRASSSSLLGLSSSGLLLAETGTLEQVLLLARGVLCPDLLAVDALDGETLLL